MSSRARTFRDLHASGCFLLPNPWDRGSAIALESLGFSALATTSAGFAFSIGARDHPLALELEAVLAHVAALVGATRLPVTADYQSGFAREPEELARNVTLCVRTGVAGLSIEDSSGDPQAPLLDHDLAVERIVAARAAIDDEDPEVVLTARSEAWLVGHPDRRRLARERLVAFAEAGADCLFAPGVFDPAAIAELVRAVAPKPVNVLMSRPAEGLTLAHLADLGVRRVSVGSALARVAWGAFLDAARSLRESGAFDALAGAVSFAELNELFGEHPRGSRPAGSGPPPE